MNNIEFIRLTINNIKYIKESIIIDDIEYKNKDLISFIENENNYIFIGIIQDEVVCFLYGYGLLRPDGKNMFYIYSVDVLPNFQGKGIGTNLIQFTINYIKNENKYYKIWVLADTNNIRACKLYSKYALELKQNLYNIDI